MAMPSRRSATCSSSPRRRARGKTSLTRALLEREPASACRCRTRRARRVPASATASTTTSSTPRSLRVAQGAPANFSSMRTCMAIGTRPPRPGSSPRSPPDAGRPARDRLAGRSAGPRAHSGFGARLHPAAVAGVAARNGWSRADRTTPRPSRAASTLRGRRFAIAWSSIMLLLIRTLPRRSTILPPIVRATRLRTAQQRVAPSHAAHRTNS